MRETGQLTVGPLRFSLRTAELGSVRYADPAYAGFFAESAGQTVPASRDLGAALDGAQDLAPALAEMPVNVVRRAERLPAGEPLWQAGGHWAVWEDGADLVFHVGLQAPEAAKYACRAARDVSRAELAIPPAAWTGGNLESPLRYPLDQILSWGLLSRMGGALLHSAVALKDGVGYVFAGRSGAGKSTLSALCHAAGWRILNDDRAMVFRRGGEWRVAGTPWHGSGRFAEAAEAPLGGLFFLQQAAACRVESLTAKAARLALLDVAAVPWFEEAWSQGTLDGLDRLVRDVETSRFHFTKTPDAVAALASAQPFQRSGACA